MGSIKRKGRGWIGVLRENNIEKSTHLCATEGEAEQALARMLGGEIDPRLLPTLQEWWFQLLSPGSEWEDRKDRETLNLYDTCLINHIHGTPLGKMRIDLVRTLDIQRHINRMYKDPELKVRTVNRYASCISQIFGFAVETKLLRNRLEYGEVIFANPCEGIKLQKPADPSDIYIFDDSELSDLPAILHEYSPRLSAMLTVLADTGCRPGELCAMRTSAIKDRIWTIDRAMDKRGILKDYTKTRRTRRVYLTDDCLEAIESQKISSGYIWMSDRGTPMNPMNLARHIGRFRDWLQAQWDKEDADKPKKRTVPPITARNFRRTFITRGVEQGNAKSVQAVAGHSTSKTTLDVYAQARANPQQDLIQKLSEGIKRPRLVHKGQDRGNEKLSISHVEAG